MGEARSIRVSKEAVAVAAVVARWPSWLHQRHETISFESVSSIHRRIRLDFSIPKDLVGLPGDWIPVPLAVIRKTERATLEVVDEAGVEAIVLTSVENRKLTAEMLLAQLHQDVCEEGVDGADLYTEETKAELLDFVSGEDSVQMGMLSNRWEERLRPSFGGWLGPGGIRSTTRTLMLVRRFFYDELIFVALPADSATRRVLTMRHDESIVRFSRPGLRSEMGRRHLADRVTESLGWRDTLTSLIVRDAGCAGSLDLAVKAPDGVVLQAMPVHTFGEAPLEEVASAKADNLGGRQMLHVRLSGLRLWENANVLVFLRAELNYPAAVAMASLFAAVALTVGALSLGQLNQHTDAAVTLFLAGPTLFASLIALRGRETLALQIVRGPRMQLGVVALATFAAAASLVAAPAGCSQTAIWTVLASIAWLATAALAVGLIQRIVQLRRVRAAERAAFDREREDCGPEAEESRS
jgi:hypothetical protein